MRCARVACSAAGRRKIMTEGAYEARVRQARHRISAQARHLADRRRARRAVSDRGRDDDDRRVPAHGLRPASRRPGRAYLKRRTNIQTHRSNSVMASDNFETAGRHHLRDPRRRRARGRSLPAEGRGAVPGAGRGAWRRLAGGRAQRVSVLGQVSRRARLCTVLDQLPAGQEGPEDVPAGGAATCWRLCNSCAAAPASSRSIPSASDCSAHPPAATSPRSRRSSGDAFLGGYPQDKHARRQHQGQGAGRRLRRLRPQGDVAALRHAEPAREQHREFPRRAADGEPAALFRCIVDQLCDRRQQSDRRVSERRHRGRPGRTAQRRPTPSCWR